MESDQRVKTLAEYLEKTQWAVRPCAVADTKPAIGDPLPVDSGDVKRSEVSVAVKRLKLGKAAGPDKLVSEYFKTLASSPEGLDIIVNLCQICWKNKEAHSSWMVSRVTLLFKKGDPAACENYRPISLLAIGYKILASILLTRLKKAGAESRIWSTNLDSNRRRAQLTHSLSHADYWTKHGLIAMVPVCSLRSIGRKLSIQYRQQDSAMHCGGLEYPWISLN